MKKGPVFLVFDIGTSDIKCGGLNEHGEVLVECSQKFPMVHQDFNYEIDFETFLEIAVKLIHQCVKYHIDRNEHIEALLITTQAQTFTAVDSQWNPLRNGLVWLDERAKEEADYLNDHIDDFPKLAGFQQPLPMLYISKLLWLKNHEINLFEKAAHFPLINEYLVYRLTGRFYTDSTNFGMTGIYDYQKKTINRDILKILELDKDYFPEIRDAATQGELITNELKRNWSLNYRFPVYLCGNDQCASATGAGVDEPGDVNINFGTAMVIYTITSKLISNLDEDQISGKHSSGDKYFLLSYESDFGIQMRMLKNSLYKEGTYDELFSCFYLFPDANEHSPVSQNICDHMSEYQPQKICAGVIKYYLTKLISHLTRIRDHVDFEAVYLSGGMLQSKVLLKILNENIDVPIIVNKRVNAGLTGALDIYMQNKNQKKYAY